MYPTGSDAREGVTVYDLSTDRIMTFIDAAWVIAGGKMPRVSAVKFTTQSITDSATTLITFPDTEDYDTDSIHSTSVNTSRLTVPTGLAGRWLVTYSLFVGTVASAGRHQCWLAITGGTERYAFVGASVTANDDASVAGADELVLVVGDYVELNYFQDNVGNTARNAGSVSAKSRLKMSYLGPS